MPKKKPLSSKKKAKKLKEDLEEISQDWEELLRSQKLTQDELFLGKIADDILALSQDAHDLEDDSEWEDTAYIVGHLLKTPWGAPFVSHYTLLDAAINYQSQDPKSSDLSHLMQDFSRYGHQFENQIFKLFEDILEDFDQQSY